MSKGRTLPEPGEIAKQVERIEIHEEIRIRPEPDEFGEAEPKDGEDRKALKMGDIVIYHHEVGNGRTIPFPAIVQRLFEDGTARVYIFSEMSVYQTISRPGDGAGCFSLR